MTNHLQEQTGAEMPEVIVDIQNFENQSNEPEMTDDIHPEPVEERDFEPVVKHERITVEIQELEAIEEPETEAVEEPEPEVVEEPELDTIEEPETEAIEEPEPEAVEEPEPEAIEEPEPEAVEEPKTEAIEEPEPEAIEEPEPEAIEEPEPEAIEESEPETLEEPESDTDKEPEFESNTEDVQIDIEDKTQDVNYAGFTRKEMMDRLRNLLVVGDVDTIRREIDILKYQFYRKLKAEEELKRALYIENGGSDDNYLYEEDEQELILKNLLNKYREIRQIQNEQMESEKQGNLEKKLKIIEELKELTNSTESIGGTFQQFRELQNRWRVIGLVPQNEVKNLWDTYHHYVEIFYDYIKINRELRDLDFKRNLEAKIELCEKTEALLLEPSVVKAFQSLQIFHDQWRDIGPVPKEKRVEIWERFKMASTQVNKKHQDHFDSVKETQKNNKEAKDALCEKVEEIIGRPMTSTNQWKKNAQEVVEIQKLWNTIGHAGKRDNDRLSKRFHSLCDSFFKLKREYTSHEKDEQFNNLQLKQDLCVQAEALKDSTEWKATTEEFIQLQNKWKEIGNVPPKHREAIWKRFRKACNYFFEQKSNHYSSVESEYDNNLKAKQSLIEGIKNFKHSNNPRENFEQLKEFQRQWSDIGFVPYKHMKKIQDEFRNAINKQFESLQMDDKERNRLQYRNKIETMVTASKSRNKLGPERDRLMRRYQQLQSDLVVWENNIGFFSKSKSSAAMVNSVQQMIEQGKVEMKELEEKIKIIDSMDKV